MCRGTPRLDSGAMSTSTDHDHQRDGGWARVAALFGSLPFRQLAGPAVVFLFWPVRPSARPGRPPDRPA
jgi:hypothetical protein